MTVVCLLPTSTGSSSQRLARDGGRSVACPRTMAPGRVVNGRIQRVLAFRERCRWFLLCSRSQWSGPDPERTEQTVPRALGRAISRTERASPNAHLSLALGYPRTMLPGTSAASMAGIPSWCPQPPEWLRSPVVFDCGGWGRWQSLRAPTAWGGHPLATMRRFGESQAAPTDAPKPATPEVGNCLQNGVMPFGITSRQETGTGHGHPGFGGTSGPARHGWARRTMEGLALSHDGREAVVRRTVVAMVLAALVCVSCTSTPATSPKSTGS